MISADVTTQRSAHAARAKQNSAFSFGSQERSAVVAANLLFVNFQLRRVGARAPSSVELAALGADIGLYRHPKCGANVYG